MARGSGGGYTFSQVPTADIPRSVFNRSHGHKTTFDSGYLIPIFVDEVLPGDTFKLDAAFFARLSTPIVPIMDNLYLDAFFFFVPNRLLWSNWQKFCGEQVNPGDSTSFNIPILSTTGFAALSVGDYFGLPCLGSAPTVVNALPFRAYNLIYNEWFRDENLVNSAPKNMGDGPDALADYTLRKRGKRHDYFTACLPWPQKGVGVMLPLGTTAPVTGNIVGTATGPSFKFMNSGTPGPLVSQIKVSAATAGSTVQNTTTMNSTGGVATVALWDNPQLSLSGAVADLSSATAATINSLRQAFQIQKLLERDARGGTRYVEILRAHFGVVSPDARLQRPEYLGGGTVPILINPVAQTSATGLTGGNTPVGKLAGYGVAAGHGLGFSKSFVEHGYVIGLVCARADLSYQQGAHRMWSRRTRYDFYWPAFANLGEQAVLNKEIYSIGDGGAQDDAVFGYQERWAEYRYFPSKITGKFNSTAVTPLDFWHLAQKFTALPVLNQTFIEEAPPISRVVAVTTEPQFIMDAHFKMACTRPMPTYSVPGLIDHF